MYEDWEYQIDYLYKLIPIEGTHKQVLNNEVLRKEFERLKNICQLGLISKIFPLSKHNKLEHSYGVYHLVNKVDEIGDIRNRADLKLNSLRIAALTHGIGHFPYTFASEKTVLSLTSVSPGVNRFVEEILESVGERICESCTTKTRKYKCYKVVLKNEDIFSLYRWISAYKLMKEEQNLCSLGLKDFHFESLLKYLVCNENVGKQLLDILDKIDYVIRDLYFLGLIKVDLNVDYYLKQIKVDSQKNIKFHRIWKTVKDLEDYLVDTTYYHRKVKALEGIYEKVLRKHITDGTLILKDLLDFDDSNMESKLNESEILYGGSKTRFSQLEKKVIEGSIGFVNILNVPKQPRNLITVEKTLVRRKISKFFDYPFSDCFYVNLTPLSKMRGFRISFLCDLKVGDVRKCFDAIANSELEYTIPGPTNEEDLTKFLLGEENEVTIGYERYLDISSGIISEYLEYDHDKEKIDIVKDDGVRRFFFYLLDQYGEEEAKDFIITRLLDFPQSFSHRFLKDVENKIRNYRKDKKDRGIEFIKYVWRSYDDTIPHFPRSSKRKWIIPHVELRGKRKGEIDVFCVYVFEGRRPLIDLVECSKSNSTGKHDDATNQLRKIKNLLFQRFGRKIEVRTFLNDSMIPV